MKKHVLITALALAVGLMLVPAVTSAPALAKTQYLTTSNNYFFKSGGTWEQQWGTTSTYNKKNLLTKTVEKQFADEYMGTESTTTKTKYTYDKKGRTKTIKTYEGKKLTNKTKISYTKKTMTRKDYEGKKYVGKTVTKITSKKNVSKRYNAKGKKISETTIKFDKKGNLKSMVEKVGGKIVSKQKNTIKNGKIKTSTYWNYEDGKVTGKYTYKYTYKGKYRTEKSYDQAGNLNYASKTYTEKKTGHIIDVWHKSYNEGKLYDTTTYKTKKYKSGKLKGIVKQVTAYGGDGTAFGKTVYKVKAVKAK